jgi:hypothetical protein
MQPPMATDLATGSPTSHSVVMERPASHPASLGWLVSHPRARGDPAPPLRGRLRETLAAEVLEGGGVKWRRVAEMTLWKNYLVFCSHFNCVCKAKVLVCEW